MRMEATDTRKEPESLEDALDAVRGLRRKNAELLGETKQAKQQCSAYRLILGIVARHPLVRLVLGRRVRRLLRENGVNLTIDY